MKEDLKKMAALHTAKRLATWPDGEGMKKKLWGMKEGLEKKAAFLIAKRLAT
jgi:hypothetical protein